MGKVATYTLLSRGAPPLQSGGINHKWPTNGQGGYIPPAVPGSPSAAERKLTQMWPTNGNGGYITPAVSGTPSASERGTN